MAIYPQISFLDLRNGGTTSGSFASYVGSSGPISLGALRGATEFDSNGGKYIAPTTGIGIGFFLYGYPYDPTGGQGSGSGTTYGAGDGPGGFM